MDIMDTHKCTAKGKRCILVVKYTDAFPLRRHTARSVANMFVTRWITYHGVPSQIPSDQGKEFEGHLFCRLSKLRLQSYVHHLTILKLMVRWNASIARC